MTIEQKTPEGQALGPTKFKGHKIVTIANILHYAPNTVLKALPRLFNPHNKPPFYRS